MFKCTIWLDAACLSSTLCESEAISESNLRPPLIWNVESHESDQSTRKTEGSLTPRALANWSCVTHQLSLKVGLGDMAPKIITIIIFISVDIDNYHDKCQIFISFKFKARFLLQSESFRNQTINFP